MLPLRLVHGSLAAVEGAAGEGAPCLNLVLRKLTFFVCVIVVMALLGLDQMFLLLSVHEW